MEPSHENAAQNSIDEPTVQAAAVGDRRALRDIYEATSDRVFRLMIRMVGVQDADDLTQQVFVRAFSNSFWALTIEGISFKQGTHHVAQKLSKTFLPL